MKRRNFLLPTLLTLAAVVIIGFAWWTISIPTAPNLSSSFPAVRLTDPVQGPESAKITIVVYSDFQCDFCGEWNELSKQIMQSYGNEVRFVWKDFPISESHPEAESAAVAARCAQQQFAFWEYHNQLFAHQDQLGAALYTDIADDLGLDMQLFTQCRSAGQVEGMISQSRQEGVSLGVSSTPTIYIGQYVLKELPSLQTVNSLITSLLNS